MTSFLRGYRKQFVKGILTYSGRKYAGDILFIFSAILIFIGCWNCDEFEQDVLDEKNDIFIMNNTSCTFHIFMDQVFEIIVEPDCQNCVIKNVENGEHLLEAYKDNGGAPGTFADSITIEVSGLKDWWWTILYCPPDPTPTVPGPTI